MQRWTALLAVLVLLLTLAACGEYVPFRRWHYIIPDGYQGFIAIRFNCPNGTPLIMHSDTITVTFDADGLYCTSDAALASTGPFPTAATASGAPIPYALDPYMYTGYAVCCALGTRVIGGNTVENPGPDIVVRVEWVGQLVPRPSSEPEAPDDLQRFLQSRFHLVPVQ